MNSRARHSLPGHTRTSPLRAAAISEGGFTLMEVVVALAILGTGVIMLLESHYGSMRLFADAQERAMTDSLLVEAIGLAEQSVLTGERATDGDFGLRYPDYSWSYTSRTLNSNDFPGLVEITLTITTPAGDEARTFFIHDGRQEIDERTENRKLLRQ